MSDESVAADYFRMGVAEDGDASSNSSGFRLDASVNSDYSLCSTYPAQLCVPSTATAELLRAVAAYRSRGRLPVLCWRDPSSRWCTDVPPG